MLDDMVGVSDMVLLEPLSEDALIENLWDRYNNKDIYVSNDIRICALTIGHCSTLQKSPAPRKNTPLKLNCKIPSGHTSWYNN